MGIFEYDEELAKQALTEDAMEKGIKQGIKQGMEQGRAEMIVDFLSNGGTEEQAKTMLKATDNEIIAAKELLVLV